MADTGRREQLAASLDEVRERITRACTAAGRDPSAVTLVAVTKTYPASDVGLLAGLGVTDVGENKDQEAAGKAAELRDVPVRWHFVGQLQRNKARSVVTYADVVESVDSLRLARALDGAAGRHLDRPLDVLVQVSLDGDPGRGGAVDSAAPGGGRSAAEPERDLWRVVDAVAASAHLRLGGLMAVAPASWHPDAAFEKLAGIAARVVAGHPGATTISAGMSGDLESAISHGATHVRIGTSLLGMRKRLR